MAGTYAAGDALTFAKTMIKKMPLDDVTVQYQFLTTSANSYGWPHRGPRRLA